MSKFDIVKMYIDEYDYYRLLAQGAPDDEFDSYSRRIAEVIAENSTIEEISMLIAKTLDGAFGNEIKPERFIDMASKIRNSLYGDDV